MGMESKFIWMNGELVGEHPDARGAQYQEFEITPYLIKDPKAENFEAACRDGKQSLDSPDNQMCAETYEVALLAAGGILEACREIMRIGGRGYIETPTRTSDIMFNFTKLKGHHRLEIAGRLQVHGHREHLVERRASGLENDAQRVRRMAMRTRFLARQDAGAHLARRLHFAVDGLFDHPNQIAGERLEFKIHASF